jgi:hypothetical protein
LKEPGIAAVEMRLPLKYRTSGNVLSYGLRHRTKAHSAQPCCSHGIQGDKGGI